MCLRVLISTLFLIILLLFSSLDTSGTWNVNRPATKTSTRDTYSALLGSWKFILDKNWPQDPIFVVTSFLSILSTSSKFSTGHTFHLFKLIFSVVTSFVLLSEEKISKKEKEKEKESQKNNDSPKIEKKRGAKVEQYIEEHIESPIWAVFACANFCLLPNNISAVHITWYI